ncbi:MAG: protein kinase [Planctomycetes bacterium]|nr:protein kinase [Planctomycetota bacterium]
MLEVLALRLAQLVATRLGGIAIDRVLGRLLDRMTGARRPASVEEVRLAVREALAEEGAPVSAADRALGESMGELHGELARAGKRLEDLDRFSRESSGEIRGLVGEDLSARLDRLGDRVIAELEREPARAARLQEEILGELSRIAPRLERIEERIAGIEEILAPLRKILDRKAGEEPVSEADLAATLSAAEKKTVDEVERRVATATRSGACPGAVPFRELGRAWYIGRDHKRALANFQEAALRDPQDGAAWRGVFFAALGLDKREIALDALRKLGDVAPALMPFPADYEVESVIGRGGMGVVFGARYRPTGRKVAIKTISPSELVEGEEGALRLLREAKLADRVDDERVVRIREVFEGPWPMIVMEQVEGPDLGAMVREKGPFAPTNCLKLVRQIAKGLAAIHAVGMVHRDIKPENVLLTAKGSVKITDLGLALLEGGSALSKSGVSPGTAAYHDKDAAKLSRTDPRLDLYSLGQTLYYLATGRVPLGAIELDELPGELREVYGLLVGPPEKRPRDAGAFLETLARPVAFPPREEREPSDFTYLCDEIFERGGARHTVGVYSDQMHAFEALQKVFSRSLSAAFSGYLRTIIEVKLVSVDQLTYSEFIISLPNPTCFNLVTTKPLEGKMILELNPSIVYPIIDRLLGGASEQVTVPDRPLTDIEWEIISRISRLILEQLSRAWANIRPLKLELSRKESNPQLMQIVAPNAPVVHVCFELTMGSASGLVNLCVPFIPIERAGLRRGSESPRS